MNIAFGLQTVHTMSPGGSDMPLQGG